MEDDFLLLDSALDSLPSTGKPVASQMSAWIFALSSEAGARDRLAESLLQGVDPWVKTAVIRGWETATSMTLHEAVIAARDTLGKTETVSRLSLLARHSRPAQSPYEQRVLARLVRIGTSDYFPASLMERWSDLTPRPQAWRGLLPLVVQRALNDSAWGIDALNWAHKTIAPMVTWPEPLQSLLERAEDPVLRDQYWALTREPEAKPRAGGFR